MSREFSFPILLTSPPAPVAVGGVVYPPNKLAILTPWITLVAAITAGVTTTMRRLRAKG